jgi:hypothetical protein
MYEASDQPRHAGIAPIAVLDAAAGRRCARIADASVLVLGRRLAGMVAAIGTAQAGYRVQILIPEPRRRPLLDAARRSSPYTELGGEQTQRVRIRPRTT